MEKRITKKEIIERNKYIFDAILSSVKDGLLDTNHPHHQVLKEEFGGETWYWWMALVETDQVPQFAQSHPEILTVNSFLKLCGKKVEGN